MTEVRGYRDLRVWQAGMDLVERIYALTQSFPLAERYGLTSQIQRAAVSIPANIAEGHTRDHTREYARHVSVARGSLAALETHLEIAVRLGYTSRSEADPLFTDMTGLGRQLTALRDSLQRRIEQLDQRTPARPARP